MSPNGSREVIDFRSELTKELVTHRNVKQELVITTVDKLKLCLIEYKEHLRSRREWIGPAGILVALIAALVAADFKEALGVGAPTWEALFLLSAILMGGLTVSLGIRAILSIKRGGVDALIDRIAARSAGDVQGDLYATALAQWLKNPSPWVEEVLSDAGDDEDAS